MIYEPMHMVIVSFWLLMAQVALVRGLYERVIFLDCCSIFVLMWCAR